MTIEHLEREIRLLKTYAMVTAILIVAALFAVPGVAQSQRQRFTEIDVERINVVEPDGRIALAIANTQRIPGPMIDGKELPRELSQGRIGSAGIIFFDPQGTEVGGLIFRTELRPDGKNEARPSAVTPRVSRQSGSDSRASADGYQRTRTSPDCHRSLKRGAHGIRRRSRQGHLLASAIGGPLDQCSEELELAPQEQGPVNFRT